MDNDCYAAVKWKRNRVSGRTNGDQRYTLAEAEIEIARRECATTGHLFDVIELVGSGDPQGIVCTRVPKRRPKRRQTGLSETQRRRMEVRKTPCPHCGANPDKRCQDRNGVESEGNHPARVEAAQRARDEQGAALV